MKVEWRPHSEEQGHCWEAAYRDGVMVFVRCANCKLGPVDVLREDFTSEPWVVGQFESARAGGRAVAVLANDRLLGNTRPSWPKFLKRTS